MEVLIYVKTAMRKVLGSITDRVKQKTLKLDFAASPLSMQLLGVRAKTGHPIVSIMCLRKVAYLLADCFSYELKG